VRRSPTDSAPSPRSASRDTTRPSRRGRVCSSDARRSRWPTIAASESAGDADSVFKIFPRARETGRVRESDDQQAKIAFYGPDRRGENAIPATPREHYE
jgi:hypothetical protein